MDYETLIRQALATFEEAPSLAELLNCIDAINRSVPFLVELNDAFAKLAQSEDFHLYDWKPVSQETYSAAMMESQEWMVRSLQELGFTREQQDAVFSWHASLWPKREA